MEAIVRTTFAMVLAGAFAIASASPARAATCEDLLRLTLPDTKITAAHTIAAGQFTPAGDPPQAAAARAYAALPPFCRIAATLTPSADSDIKVGSFDL
jgi:feruloyl esterase